MLFSGLVSGQTKQIDSLEQIISNDSLLDSSRVKALVSLISPGNAYHHPKVLLRIDSLYQSILYFKLTKREVGDVTNNIGKALNNTGNFRASVERLTHFLMDETIPRDTQTLYKVWNTLGTAHLEIGSFSEAIDCYQRSLVLCKAVGYERGVAVNKSTIGLAYANLGYYQEALDALFEGLEVDIASNAGPRALIYSYTNIGIQYMSLKQYEKALQYHLKALNLAKESNDTLVLPTVLLNLSNSYKETGQVDQYKQHLFLGHKAALLNKNDPLTLAQSQYFLGSYYHINNKLDSSSFWISKSLEIARKVDKRDLIKSNLEILQEVYEAKGDFEAALLASKQLSVVSDSLYSDENRNAIVRLEIENQLEQQKLRDEMAFQRAISNEELRSRAIMFFSIIVILILSMVYVLSLQNKDAKAKSEKAELFHMVERLKDKMAVQIVISDESQVERKELNKERVEGYLGTKIGPTSWNILNELFKDPAISNKELAAKLFLSVEGLSSSLRRMYKTFDVQSKSSKNLKIALITKVVKVSLGDYSDAE